ncbi:hypothetical protein Tco_1059839, partial [Tanacetum coccineum]
MSRKRVLILDKDSESIDNTKYRGMIGSLLYFNASRHDIMFSVCLCTRFQEDPKVSHLDAVKIIFRRDGESSKKLKRKFETMKGYEGDERIMFEFILRGFMEKARMESREMLLSIYHSLKMLLDIISKINKKLEDEKIKRNDKERRKFQMGEKESKAEKLIDREKQAIMEAKSNSVHGSSKA